MNQKTIPSVLLTGLLAVAAFVFNPFEDNKLWSDSEIAVWPVEAASTAPMGDPSVSRDVASAAPAPTAGIYGAPVGSRFHYRFDSQRSFTMTARGHTNQAVDYRGEGRLLMTVLARRDDELLVDLQCRDLELTGHSGTETGRDLRPLTEQICAGPLQLCMGQNGQHRGLRFAPSHGLEARQWLRNLVAGLQFVVGDEGAVSWDVEQDELGGTTRVHCTWETRPEGPDAGTLRRDLVAIVRCADGMSVDPTVEGRYTARLGGELAWLHGSTGSERWEVTLPDSDITVRSERRARFDLVDHERGSIPTGIDWQGPWAPLDGATDGAQLARDQQEQQLRQQLAGLSVEAVALAVMQTAEGGQTALDALTAARQQLADLLRLRPEELAVITDLLRQTAPESRGASELLAAVGEADTPAAEGFLRELVGDGSQPEVLRLHTAVAMFQLSNASPATIAVGRDLVLGSNRGSDLQRTGILLLGRFGDGGSAAAAAIEDLRQLEPMAREGDLLTTWLEALGNSRSEAAVPLAARYLQDPDENVRVAAVHAMEAVHTAAATALLVDRLTVETIYPVRQALVFALGNRADPAAVATMAKLLANDPEVGLRRLALDRLAAVPGTTVTQLLQRSAGSDPSPQIRERAATLLASR